MATPPPPRTSSQPQAFVLTENAVIPPGSPIRSGGVSPAGLVSRSPVLSAANSESSLAAAAALSVPTTSTPPIQPLYLPTWPVGGGVGAVQSIDDGHVAALEENSHKHHVHHHAHHAHKAPEVASSSSSSRGRGARGARAPPKPAPNGRARGASRGARHAPRAAHNNKGDAHAASDDEDDEHADSDDDADSDARSSDSGESMASTVASSLEGCYATTPLRSLLSASPALYACVCCTQMNTNAHQLLEHMRNEHNVQIRNAEIIADLPQYLLWWRERLLHTPLEKSGAVRVTPTTTSTAAAATAPAVMAVATTPATAAAPAAPTSGQSTETPVGAASTTTTAALAAHWLLCEELAEDRELREELQRTRLQRLIEQQQLERRNANFSHKCLFCKKLFEGDRAVLFQHMFAVHKFNIGLPDNIVHMSELLQLLQSKIDNLLCLYCEKKFKSYSVLKLHMRKKKHFKIDARNHQYDRFYLVNYLEAGKDWRQIQNEPDDDDFASAAGTDTTSEGGVGDRDWGDWVEQDDGDDACVCLFCAVQSSSAMACLAHMKDAHEFDFAAVRKELKCDFYDSVKLINFIRRSVFELHCPRCNWEAPTHVDLYAHMQHLHHCNLPPDATEWRDAQYFFPTYENDGLLHGFTNTSAGDDADGVPDEVFAWSDEEAPADAEQAPRACVPRPRLPPEAEHLLLSHFQQDPSLIERLKQEPALIHTLLQGRSVSIPPAAAGAGTPPPPPEPK